MPSFDDLRVLLIQARNTTDMQRQERQCFLDRTRLAGHQLVSHNLPDAAVTPEHLEGYDAFLIGGAGEYSAHHDYPWMPPFLETCRAAAECQLPTFGSCWGHQIIARAFGGEVIHDPERAEMGCIEVTLTEAGEGDELLGRFPHTFHANAGHHDRVTRLPENAVELVRNEQPHQAFRLKDAPVYGTQFHSELDAAAERERLVKYRSYYEAQYPTDAAFQEVLDGLAATTVVDHLLHDFLVHFCTNAQIEPEVER